MAGALRDLLQRYRDESASEREKGTYFERLTKVWLENAPTQADQFLRVMTFGDWAAENRFDQRDTGIDLVAWHKPKAQANITPSSASFTALAIDSRKATSTASSPRQASVRSPAA